MPKTLTSDDDPTATADGSAHRQLSAMIDAGRAFSGHERNCCFLNTRDGRFADLSAGSGLDFPDDGRALAACDWDGDGDLDLWISNRNAPRLRLMRNDSAAGNHFLALQLVGDGKATSRDAIGARVELRLAGDRLPLVRSLRAGEGFLSQSSKWLHFGLGEGGQIAGLSVRWPDGAREEFSGVAADGRYRLRQGGGLAEPLPGRPGSRPNLAASPGLVAASSGAARIPAVTLLRMPTFNLKRADGSQLGGAEGRSLLINLWATWCAPCLAELAEFRDRAAELRAAGVEVLALNVDGIGGGATGAVDPAQVLARLQFPFAASAASEPLVATLQGFHDSLVGLKRPLPVPTSFLVDPQGRLAVIYKGAVSVDQLLADLPHSAGSLDERLSRAAQLPGSTIAHPEVQRTARVQEASIQHRFGLALHNAKDLDAAIYHFSTALALDPSSAQSALQLAQIYRSKQDWNRAADHFEIALRLAPEDADAHHALAQLRSRLGQTGEASGHYEAALQLEPGHALANFGFAALLAAHGEPARAVSLYKRGLESQPGNHVAANNLAWLLATHPDDAIRDPAEALRRATELNAATGDRVPNILDTLSAAQAATGDFPAASATAARAIQLATANGDQSLATALAGRRAQFQAAKPYREPASPTPQP